MCIRDRYYMQTANTQTSGTQTSGTQTSGTQTSDTQTSDTQTTSNKSTASYDIRIAYADEDIIGSCTLVGCCLCI